MTQRCFICLGRIKRPEDRTECPKCARLYHVACARRLRFCPMCGEDMADIEPVAADEHLEAEYEERTEVVE